MSNPLNYLALARKAGLAELGEEPVGAAARAGKAYVICVTSDASDHTWRRAKSYAAGTEQQCIRLDATKDEMGAVVGRTSLAIAAITDPSMALAMVQALGSDTRYADAIAVLKVKSDKAKRRRAEANAHKKNVRFGKKK